MDRVAILTNKEGYEKLIALVLNSKAEIICRDLSKEEDIYIADSPATITGYEYIFKYSIPSSFKEDLKVIYDGIEGLKNKDIPYKFARIGEELCDIEYETNDINKELLTHIHVEKTIEIDID